MAEMVRVNTRLPVDINDWLDEQSEKTGVPKSTQILLALEQYVQQKTVIAQMTDMGVILQALERLENKIENEN